MNQLNTNWAVFDQAAGMFAEFVEVVPAEEFDRSATDQWSVRDLIGHTLRAATTVIDSLAQPAPVVDHLTPGAYLHHALATIDDASIAERARAAGAALGDDPAAIVHEQLSRVRAAVAGLDFETDDPIVSTRGGSMHLSTYLPTRTLELVLHSLDVAQALDRDLIVPIDPMRQTLELLTEVVVLDGGAAQLARVLSGRGALPSGFSIFAR